MNYPAEKVGPPRRRLVALRACRLFGAVLLTLLSGCVGNGPDALQLVPPTVTENPDLPQMSISVGGRERSVHLRTFGSDTAPVLFILNGGLGSDHRRIIPFAELFASEYHVVLWDERGAGLSERVTREEISRELFVEELNVLIDHFSPNEPVRAIGESWGGIYLAMYLEQHANRIHQAVFVEPGALRSDLEVTSEDFGNAVFFSRWVQALVWDAEFVTPRDHAEADYKWLYAWDNAVGNFFCEPEKAAPVPIWRYAALMAKMGVELFEQSHYDFTEGIGSFPRKLLVVGTSCSTLGYEFQQRQKEYFNDAELVRVEDHGHYLSVEDPHLLYGVVADYFGGG